jgi:hypothetical protein
MLTTVTDVNHAQLVKLLILKELLAISQDQLVLAINT